MKRKTIIILISLVILGNILAAKGMKFELKGHYYMPRDEIFNEVYGNGIAFGAEFSYEVWKGIFAWFGGSSFSKSGEFTFSGDNTDVKIIPFELGLRYVYEVSPVFSLYGGLGLAYVLFDEENFLGAVTQNQPGGIAALGVTFNMKNGIFIDIFADYLMCTLEPNDVEFSISGIMTGIGIGICF